MNAPIVMLVSVILWSFGISAAALVGLMFLDWLETRRAGFGRGITGPRLDRIGRPQHGLPATA